MKFVLAFERNKNDYVPIDLSLFENNGGLQLSTLEEIDHYTMTLTEEEFRRKAGQTNIYSENEISAPIIITYYENGKVRKLEDGPVFEDRANFLSVSYILEYVLAHFDDAQARNHLYNVGMKKKNKSTAFTMFLESLHQRQTTNLKQIAYAEYIEIRMIALYLANMQAKEKEQDSIAMVLKNKDAA